MQFFKENQKKDREGKRIPYLVDRIEISVNDINQLTVYTLGVKSAKRLELMLDAYKRGVDLDTGGSIDFEVIPIENSNSFVIKGNTKIAIDSLNNLRVISEDMYINILSNLNSKIKEMIGKTDSLVNELNNLEDEVGSVNPSV